MKTIQPELSDYRFRSILRGMSFAGALVLIVLVLTTSLSLLFA